jgi:hypothetical protein
MLRLQNASGRWMRIKQWWTDSDWRKSRYTQKHVPLALSPLQIPYTQTKPWTWASVVTHQWLTTWTMAWQSFYSCIPLKNQIWVLSEFHLCLNETFALLGCHAALIGSWLLTFPDNLSGPSSRVKGEDCLTHEDETKRLSHNICNYLPINVA